MIDHPYAAPKLRPIVIGIALFVLFLLVMCSLSDLVKGVGYPFLLLPEKLGILQVAHRSDVRVIHMQLGQITEMEFERPGWYAIYTNDYDLLLASADLSRRAGNTWVTAKTPSGSSANVDYIERGLRPYDSPFARGRPIMRMEVTETGVYRMRHPSKVADISILPDYTTGSEFAIFLVFAVQLAVLLAPAALLYRRYQLRSAARVKSVMQLKRIKGDDFWKREFLRRKEGDVKKPKDVYHSNKWW